MTRTPSARPVIVMEDRARDADRVATVHGDRQAAYEEVQTPARANPTANRGGEQATGRDAAPAGGESGGATEQRARVTMVSATEPPLLLVETPSHEPHEGEFWIAGHWRGESGKFVWQPGRIERERVGQLYASGGWVASPRGWEYTPEYWR